MATTKAQKAAKAKWDKANVTQRNIKFYPSNAAELAHFDAQPNKNAYILGLIRADMNK
jgi:hypothetical protein